MINVDVRVYATLKKYCPDLAEGEALAMRLPEGTTVGQLVEQELGIPPQVVKTVFINGVTRDMDYVLADGDRVGIFPPVAGG